MPEFNRSVLKILGRDPGTYRPWRYTVEPIYGNGPTNPPTVAGVKATPGGVFILLSDEIVDYMRATMTPAEKAEILPWIERYDIADVLPANRPQTWNVSIWAGTTGGVVLHIPNATWADPTTTPPLKVRTYFRELYS